MGTIAGVRSQDNIFDVNDDLTDDDRLMLLDVMNDGSFFKKTLELLTKHTRFRKRQRTPPSRLHLGQPQEVLHTIQPNRLPHNPLRGSYSPAGEGITTLGAMHKLQTFTWASKEHGVFTHNLTGTDHLNTDLSISTLTYHPTSPIDSHLLKLVVPCLCDNRRQAQGCPARSIELGTVMGFQYFNVVVRP